MDQAHRQLVVFCLWPSPICQVEASVVGVVVVVGQNTTTGQLNHPPGPCAGPQGAAISQPTAGGYASWQAVGKLLGALEEADQRVEGHLHPRLVARSFICYGLDAKWQAPREQHGKVTRAVCRDSILATAASPTLMSSLQSESRRTHKCQNGDANGSTRMM